VKFFLITLSALLFSSPLWAYVDQDIDGVDDSRDLCLNTPFDIIVDERGCPYDKKFLGKITFQIGGDISLDKYSDTTANLNLFLNYSYRYWNISLSDTNYDTTNLNTIDQNTNNLYLTIGYLFQYDSINSRVSIGTKFDLSNSDDNRDNDFYASLNLEYLLNNRQNIFLYYNYTLSGDATIMDYDNFHSTSIGTGYAVNEKWYSALSYNYSTSYYPGYDDYQALSWFNSYTLSKDFYITCNYAYTLDDLSYDHIISFNIGVHFD
jgi:hypothetical protein